MDLSALMLTATGDGVRFEVHAKPRAKKSALVGVFGAALDVAIAAPPIEGAANDELVRFLAKALGVSRTSVEVVRGQSSRAKLVAVRGLDPDTARARLAASATQR
jgi:uncharacterized protein (TIGR00251 family)